MFYKNIKELYVINPEIIGKNVVFYGGGEIGHVLYRYLVRSGLVNLIGIYDNNLNPEDLFYDGTVRVISRAELEALSRDTPVIIATNKTEYFQEIAKDLLHLNFHNIIAWMFPSMPVIYQTESVKERLGLAREQIERARGLLEDERSVEVFDSILRYRLTNEFKYLWNICEKNHKQYFPGSEIFDPVEDEIFIDGGCLNTATIAALKEWTSDRYKKVYAFEPSHQDKLVVDEFVRYKQYRVESVEAGLYSKNGVLSFSVKEWGLSKIDENGEEKINVVCLDDYMKDKKEKITLLKMDIEGSELEALKGSMQRIGSDHPRLAICVYHHFNDLWEILLWIHEHFPEYQFFMRHYSMTNNETVLYAKWREA